MKKRLLILGVLLTLFTTTNVKADIGAPNTKSFEGYVKNPDGAQVIDEDTIIEYGKKITVKNCFKLSSGETKCDVEDFDTKEAYGYVLQDDISVDVTEMKKEEGEKEREKRKFMVYHVESRKTSPDGIKLYKGPSSEFFEEVDGAVVPVGTVLESDTIDVYGGGWHYFTYKGKSGWGNTGNGLYGIGSVNDNYELNGVIQYNEINVCENVYINCKKVSVAPNTEFHEKITTLTTHPRQVYYYLNVDGEKGWVSQYDLIRSFQKGTKTFTQSAVMYSDMTTKEVIGTIPENTQLDILASNSSYDNDTHKYNIVYYFEYEGQKGFVEETSSNMTGDNVTFDTSYVQKPNEEEIVEPEEPTKDKDKDKNKDKKKDKKKDTVEEEVDNFLYTWIIGGVALALVALVTIILINKKRKTKKNKVENTLENASETTEVLETAEAKEVVEETKEEVANDVEFKAEETDSSEPVQEQSNEENK